MCSLMPKTPFCKFIVRGVPGCIEGENPGNDLAASNALNYRACGLQAVLLRGVPGKVLSLVAQCSATPATVAATPPCSATPFQTQISVRHLPAHGGGGGATPQFLGGVARHGATPAKRYKIQEISCDTCSATGGTRNRVQLRF